MKNWSDLGIVLSSRKYGEKYKIVNIFTKDHGKFSALASNSKNNFSLFSLVDIDWTTNNRNLMGFWKLQDEKQNWIYALKCPKKMAVLQSVCFLCDKALPIGVSYCNIFDIIIVLSNALEQHSTQTILFIYSYLEFVLLQKAGYGFDEIYKKPKIWSKWEDAKDIFNIDFQKEDIKDSLKATLFLVNKHLFQFNNFFRQDLCD